MSRIRLISLSPLLLLNNSLIAHRQDIMLKQETDIPLVISERLASRFGFSEMIEAKAGMVLPPDLPGLGLQFKKGLFERKDVFVETIAEL